MEHEGTAAPDAKRTFSFKLLTYLIEKVQVR
jgi:hypothetical protein